MLRIAYDAGPLLAQPTGVGHYTATLLDRLLAMDEDVQFTLWAIVWKKDTSRVPVGERLTLRRKRLPARVAVTLWEALGRPDGEGFLGEADVVHGTNFWIPPLRRKNGAVTIHDLTFWLYPELCTSQIQRYRWIVPRVLERCARVITPCETIRRQVSEELGFPEERIVVTPEGVRGAFTGAAPNPALAGRLGVHGDYVLFAGTQEPRKNLDRLIRALATLTDLDLQLVIAGPPGWGSVDLPAVARHLGVDQRVVFTGYLTDPELASLMIGARAFVFPSLYEGFGLPPLEAMAAGIPVVAARAGSLPEVLGDAPFWCDPLDVDSIAAAIREAAVNESERLASISKGRARAAHYDWDLTARRTLDAYRLIAAGE